MLPARASTSCTVTRTRPPVLLTLPSTMYRTPSSSAARCVASGWPAYAAVEECAMTKSSGFLARTLTRLSARPARINSSAVLLPSFAKGRTAMEGFSGSGNAMRSAEAVSMRPSGNSAQISTPAPTRRSCNSRERQAETVGPDRLGQIRLQARQAGSSFELVLPRVGCRDSRVRKALVSPGVFYGRGAGGYCARAQFRIGHSPQAAW